jgi:two-component system chemotaxis sensor kinase CheA
MVVASARVELLLRDSKADAISRADAVAALAKMVRSVQERAIALRMVTVGDMFQRFARPVRDLARELGRQVIFETHGVETQLDRKLIDQLVDPLKHLIRNAIVHGVEDPQDRIAAGKPPEGRLRLCASQQNGSAVLEVTDDGAGINRPRVIEKALELGLLAPGADPTERQIHELLFLPGFSTAKRVSEIAGRGVGLDVLRKAVETLRGKIEIISAMGKGTTFRVLLPVTLAIVDGLQVRVGTAPLIIPLAAVVELVDGFTARLVTNHGGDQSLRLRDDLLPLVHVPKVLKNIKAQSQRCSTIVVVETEHRRFGIAVDEVLGVARAVIKPLEEALMLPSNGQTEVSASAAVSGATVLPDGNVGLIMDVHGLETLVFA